MKLSFIMAVKFAILERGLSVEASRMARELEKFVLNPAGL
jgi:hypothetical protein